jgi:predicted ester cyclase
MTFLERWFEEVWNKGNEKAIDEMALPNANTHGLEHPDGKPVNGREAFKEFHQQFLTAFSNVHIKVEHTLTQDDMTMAHCTVTGVHSGSGLGIAPTNRTVKFTGMCLARIEDGKLAEAWNNFDLASMYRQVQ